MALWFPLLPIDRLRKLHETGDPSPRLDVRADAPLAVVESVRGALRVRVACQRAAALGLGRGLTLADAQTRVPNLTVVPHDPTADAALLERLADTAGWATPSVGLDPPDGLALDVTGCVSLFGSEARLRMGVLVRFAQMGVKAHAAFGDTPDAARALVRFGHCRATVPEIGVESVLDLPLAALELPKEAHVALSRAGLKKVGDLAERPTAMLAARFGEATVTRLRRVLGQEDRRVTPRRPASPIVVEQAFAEPISRLDDVEATLALLLRQVAGMLEGKGQGGRLFEAAFFRTDGAVRRVCVETGRPTRDHALLGRLFRDRLGALADPLDPGFGFDLIRLAVLSADLLHPLQGRLEVGAPWLPNDAEDATSSLVDRLVARFGRHSVTRFVPLDSHHPNRAARAAPAAGTAPLSGWPEALPDAPPLRPLQVFVPPQLIEILAELPDGSPLRFRWQRLLYEVAWAEGPERIAGEWWRDDWIARDYYRIEDCRGRRFWVFRMDPGSEVSHPRWYLHGLFA